MMGDLELLFDVKLTNQEETALLGYSGFREINKNSSGQITDIDTRTLELEKLKYKKCLKVLVNKIFLRLVPLQTQLNAALGQLTQVEIDRVKARMAKIRQIYQQQKNIIEAANSLDTLVMPDLDTIISTEINQI